MNKDESELPTVMECKSCGHIFKEEKKHMVRCPCGKSYVDWMWGNLYRWGGDVFD